MIYIHIPFCRSFCTYCDFYSEVAAKCRKAEDEAAQSAHFEEYAVALSREIEDRKTEISDDVNTLYIGGGTPSVLPLSVFRTILRALQDIGHGGPFDEFTVEVNPEDIVEKGVSYVQGLLEMGVNRISMGVQSFDDGILRWMNRRHDSETARRAYAILEEAGVQNISIDLIFGMPQLSEYKWRETLKAALEISSHGLKPQHVSSYQLSVEPGSALNTLMEKGGWSEASDEMCSQQYQILCDTLASAGYHHYEISNFALPGSEARHNSAYWHHHSYVGLGPGAHSFIGLSRQWNNPDLQAYLSAARKGDFSEIRGSEDLTADQISIEKIMLALRTSGGIPKDYLRSQCDQQALDKALSAGHLVNCQLSDGSEGLRIPEKYFFISDAIISDLI